MNIRQRREFSKTHEPEWVSKGLSRRMEHPVKEGLTGLVKGFGIAFAGKVLVGLIFALMGKRKNLGDTLRDVFSKDTVRFASFYSAWNGSFRLINALLFKFRGKDDRLNAAMAGFAAGMTLLADDEQRRRSIAIYVFVRAVSVLIKGLSREGTLPYWEHTESLGFGIINGPIMYGFLLEPEILDPGYYKWILGMGAVTDSGLAITLRQRTRDFLLTGVLSPFQPCQPHYHTGSCVGYCTTDWVAGLGRAAKIYAPVHILPLILFRYQKLQKDPVGSIAETAKALALSSMFLSTYQFNVKFSQCMLRNARQKDTAGHAITAGLLTSLACLFERPSRVSELFLFCVPKSLEAVWNYGVKYWGFQPVPFFEIPLFMVGGAILLSSLKEDLKSTYFNALKFLVTLEYKSGGAKKPRIADAPDAIGAMPIPPTEHDHDHDHDHNHDHN